MTLKDYPPMLLTEAKQLPDSAQWGYEAKLDGYRMLAESGPERTTIWSRQGNNFTDRYPAVTRELPAALGGHSAVVDGEMVGFDQMGQPSFSVLRTKLPKVVYYIFDLLELDGEPLIRQPLRDRREQLNSLVTPQPSVQVSEMFYNRDAIVEAARELKFEGVVAKRLDSPYRPGIRSKDWLKQILIRHTDGFGRH
jgi:bifunctional non-homologous end joining protein LigD